MQVALLFLTLLWTFSRLDGHSLYATTSVTDVKSVDWTKQTENAKDGSMQQTEDIQKSNVDNGSLKDSGAVLSTNLLQYQDHEGGLLHSMDNNCICEYRGEKEPIQNSQSDKLKNSGSDGATKNQQVNLAKGIFADKTPIDVKSSSRIGSSIKNWIVLVLVLTTVCGGAGFAPKVSIQLLLLLQVCCLLCSFSYRRCGQLIARYNDRQHCHARSNMKPGDHKNSPPLLLMICDAASQVYSDITHWYRCHWKDLNAAFEEHLYHICSPPLDFLPDTASAHSNDSATVAECVVGSLRQQGHPSMYDTYASASTIRRGGSLMYYNVCRVCRNIDEVLKSIKEGLRPVYEQVIPFSRTYFRLKQVMDYLIHLLVTATRVLDWPKIDALVDNLFTAATADPSMEDIAHMTTTSDKGMAIRWFSNIDDLHGNVSLERWEVSSADVSLRKLLKSLLHPITAATPTLTSANRNANIGNKNDEWFVASVDKLLKLKPAILNNVSSSFDALLAFALWPATQKLTFLFEVSGMFAVTSSTDENVNAFMMALDRDLVEPATTCVYEWRVELVGDVWEPKRFKWTEPAQRRGKLNAQELGPYDCFVALLNDLWGQRRGYHDFQSLPLSVVREIRNLMAHRHERRIFMSDQMLWTLVDTLFPSLFPFVAGAVVHKLSALRYRRGESPSPPGEEWFLEHGMGALNVAQMSYENVESLLQAVHQLSEARSPNPSPNPAANVLEG